MDQIKKVTCHVVSAPIARPFTSSRGWIYKTRGSCLVEIETADGVVMHHVVTTCLDPDPAAVAVFHSQPAVDAAVGCVAQIAQLAPVLVLISFVLGPFPMPLIFNGLELGAIMLAILIANFVTHEGESTWFDFGAWKSEVASRRNDDGSLSFMTISPGEDGFEFVVGDQDGARRLVLRDAQHEYVFSAPGAASP